MPIDDEQLKEENSRLVYDRLVIAAKARCEGFDMAMDAVSDVATEAFNKGNDELAHQYRDVVRMMRISRQRVRLGEELKRANQSRDAANGN